MIAYLRRALTSRISGYYEQRLAHLREAVLRVERETLDEVREHQRTLADLRALQERHGRLLAAAIRWRRQGGRSQWNTKPSLALVDTVDELAPCSCAIDELLEDCPQHGRHAPRGPR